MEEQHRRLIGQGQTFDIPEDVLAAFEAQTRILRLQGGASHVDLGNFVGLFSFLGQHTPGALQQPQPALHNTAVEGGQPRVLAKDQPFLHLLQRPNGGSQQFVAAIGRGSFLGTADRTAYFQKSGQQHIQFTRRRGGNPAEFVRKQVHLLDSLAAFQPVNGNPHNSGCGYLLLIGGGGKIIDGLPGQRGIGFITFHDHFALKRQGEDNYFIVPKGQSA